MSPPVLLSRIVLALAAAGMLFGAATATAQAVDPQALIETKCIVCHEKRGDGTLKRINDVRKTPEGWDMTLVRMMIWHGVRIMPHERSTLVKYLSDTQGLAPEESEPARYILERRPNFIEPFEDEDLIFMCGRCHSLARVALQRRDGDEWNKLSHTHLGQWPTTEYQAFARDREWWKIATSSIPEKLGRLYPHETAEWSAWKNRGAANLEGLWRVVGHRPGAGDYHGTMRVRRSADDVYEVNYDVTYANGERLEGIGDAVVYTGYEWRGSARLGIENLQEVYAVSADGNRMSGRWFLAAADEVGGDATAMRMGAGAAAIMQVSPPYIRAGATARISIHGTGLEGAPDLGAGVEIVDTLYATRDSVIVEARAAAGAANGTRDVRVGSIVGADGLTVYQSVDSVRVEPDYGIARVGGGATPAVTAQFEAVGYLNGADGEAGTDDDVRIGVLPATWSVANFNEIAEALQDVRYAGDIQNNGLYVPAIAGPNPERPYQTNNAGDLSVKAAVNDAGRRVEGSAHLIVTVQRWNDPPIR